MIIIFEEKSTYIYSLEGKDIYGKILEIKKHKKFKAVLDYSLEAIQINKIAQLVYKNKKDRENIFYQQLKKQYTNKVINVTFKYNVREYNLITSKEKEYYVERNSNIDNRTIKDIVFENGIYKVDDKIIAVELYSKTTLINKELPQGFGVKDERIVLTSTGLKTIANSDSVRNNLYENGFTIKYENETVEYVRFKRSSGSSRVGKCLFIDKRLYKDIIEWSMMGLKFKESDEIDLAAIEAYISLTTSSIIDTINIESKNILLIDDYESVFSDRVMVTKIQQIDGVDTLITNADELEISNNIWDGQSLLESSCFSEKYEDKGFLLLRNRFFKSACFNTNIQKFFKDNNITEISQLKGFTLADKIEDIKLITTPSSIKYLKFGSKEDYFKLLEPTFGIVKYDKPTHYFDGKMVQLHYQLLNTLQLSHNDIKGMLKQSKEYVDLLKNDNRVFRDYLKMKLDEDMKYGDMDTTEELIFTLLSLNENFYNTDICTDFKRDLIDSYLRNMRKGHILVYGNYSVLFGNGLEMLQNSCDLFDGKSLLGVDEVYCKNFEHEEELIGSRSPHITISNIWIPKNAIKEKAELMDVYFNSSKQIVHINSMNNNVMEKLSSADFDSDAILLSNHKILVHSAKKNYNNFLVSTSAIKSTKITRLNNARQKCELDIKTSKNLIGEIVNTSAYLNSKLWNNINKGMDIQGEHIQKLYKTISQLNIMSCIEIDLAKKEYSIDNQFELDKIKAEWDISIKPLFFSQFEEERLKKINLKNKKMHKYKSNDFKYEPKTIRKDRYQHFECSLDYLVEELKSIKRMKNREDSPNICDLLTKSKSFKLNDADRKQINIIIQKIIDYKSDCSIIWQNNSKDYDEKDTEAKNKKIQLIENIKKLEIREVTLWKILIDLGKEQQTRKTENKIREIEKRLITVKSEDKRKLLVKDLLKKQSLVLGFQYKYMPIQRILLTVLYQSYKELFVNMFEESKENLHTIEMVEKVNLCKEIINIYGLNYQEMA